MLGPTPTLSILFFFQRVIVHKTYTNVVFFRMKIFAFSLLVVDGFRLILSWIKTTSGRPGRLLKIPNE